MEKKRTRRNFSADFKANVVIEAIGNRESIEAISGKYELHPNQVTTWKKEFLQKAPIVFIEESELSDEIKQFEAEKENLFSQIGKLKVENELLKKKGQ